MFFIDAFEGIDRAEAIEAAERKGRLLYLDEKRSQPILAGIPAADLQTAIQEVDFKKNIQNFWMDVKWIRSGNTQYSSGTSVDGDSAFAHAFNNPGKLRTRSTPRWRKAKAVRLRWQTGTRNSTV